MEGKGKEEKRQKTGNDFDRDSLDQAPSPGKRIPYSHLFFRNIHCLNDLNI